MKIVAIALAALMFVTAGLQFNDPDPLYWITVYALAGCVPVLAATNKYSVFVSALAIGMILSGLMYSLGGFGDYLVAGDFGSITGSMEGPDAYVEPAREFIGLAMALAVVAFYELRQRRQSA